MSTEDNIDIRDKDKLDDAKIEILATNWFLPEGEDELLEEQKVMLYCLKEIKIIKDKIIDLEIRITKLESIKEVVSP